MKCTCEAWKANIVKIVSLETLARAHDMPYDGHEFLFCPWCGSRLADDEGVYWAGGYDDPVRLEAAKRYLERKEIERQMGLLDFYEKHGGL